MSADKRRLLLASVAAVLALGGVVGLPRVASAHALRIASSPNADAVLASAPTQVSITFDERPDPDQSTIQVLDASGHDHTTGPVHTAPNDTETLIVPVGKLADGVYTVAWRTLSAVDGHRAAGSFAFGVGVSQGQLAAVGGGGKTSVTDTSPPPSPLGVAGRWLLYIGLIAVLGAALVGLLVLRSISAAVILQALAGTAVAVAGSAMVITAQARDAGLGFTTLVHSSLGAPIIERIVSGGVLILAIGLAAAWHGMARRVVVSVAGTAAALGMLADVGNSHAAAGTSWVWANVLLQWVHISAVGFWIGGLGALLLAIRGGASQSRAGMARRFSFGAGIALLAVLVTGVFRAAVEIGGWGSVLSTAFGRIVLVKLGLIAVLAVLGGVNRWRNVPTAGRVLRGLRRVGTVELGVATAAVLAAALLVNVAPPASAQASSSGTLAPPPPLMLTASDYATTVKVSLAITPATAGFNAFSARVLGYDSGTPAPGVIGVELSFQLVERPDVGSSTLRLSRASDQSWTARGGNLSLDGVWAVTALVERSAQSADVHFTVPTRTAQKVDVSAVPGQPTLYTVHLSGGRTAQWYLDPQTPGADEVHVTFFDAAGNGYPAGNGVITMLPAGGSLSTLPTRQLEPGHFVGDATVRRGTYRFDAVATAADGSPLTAHVDITIGS